MWKVFTVLEIELTPKREGTSGYYLTFFPHDEQKATSGDSLAPQYLQYMGAAAVGGAGGGEGGLGGASAALICSFQAIIVRIAATTVKIPPMAGTVIPPKMKHNMEPVLRSPSKRLFLATNKVKIPKIIARIPPIIQINPERNHSNSETIPHKRYIVPKNMDRIAPINVNVFAVSTLLMLITLNHFISDQSFKINGS